jgi:hypothetical protein
VRENSSTYGYSKVKVSQKDSGDVTKEETCVSSRGLSLEETLQSLGGGMELSKLSSSIMPEGSGDE